MVDRLAAQWRDDAEMLRRRGAHPQADLLESCADELEAALRKEHDELLTIAQAAAESGYSKEHLRRLAREGNLAIQRGAGAKSRVRVRRGDVPSKPGLPNHGGGARDHASVYNAEEDARDIAQRLGGINA